MIVYYAYYFFLLTIALNKIRPSSPGGFSYWIVLLTLFFFTALRFQVGCDWSAYTSHYYNGSGMGFADALANIDPGHWLVIVFLHEFDLSLQWLHILNALIFYAGLHVFARGQPSPTAFLVLCFPVLILNMPMSAIRQASAIGFMCLAFTAFVNKRMVNYLIWVILGSAFHSSILIFILLTPLVGGTLSWYRLILAGVLALPGVYFLLQTEAAVVAEERYFFRGKDAFGAPFRIAALGLSGLLFFWFLAEKWRGQFKNDFKLAAIGSIIMLCSIALLPLSSVIADRIGYYLIPVQAMILSRIAFFRHGTGVGFLSLSPYIGLSLLFLIWTQLSFHFQSCYLPYQISIF